MEFHSVLLLKIFLAMVVFIMIFVSMFGFKNKDKKNNKAVDSQQPDDHPPRAPHP